MENAVSTSRIELKAGVRTLLNYLLPFLVLGFHLLFVLSFTKGESDTERIVNMTHWDAEWYGSILAKDYVTSYPPRHPYSNVGFFPGYPAFSYLIRELFGTSIRLSLLIASGISSLCFWFFFLKALDRVGASAEEKFWGLLLLLSYPGSLFLVVGYSESLYALSTLAYLYLISNHKNGSSLRLAALSGFMMTATRILGVAVALIPLLHNFENTESRYFRYIPIPSRRKLMVILVSLLGAGSFFLYCQYIFGNWGLYFLTQSKMWMLEFDPLNLTLERNFDFLWSMEEPVNLSRASTFLIVLSFPFFLFLLSRFFKQGKRLNDFQKLCLSSGWILFFSYFLIMLPNSLYSMLRYNIVVLALLLLGIIPLLPRLPAYFSGRMKRLLLSMVCVVQFVLQAYYITLFSNAIWVG